MKNYFIVPRQNKGLQLLIQNRTLLLPGWSNITSILILKHITRIVLLPCIVHLLFKSLVRSAVKVKLCSLVIQGAS